MSSNHIEEVKKITLAIMDDPRVYRAELFLGADVNIGNNADITRDKSKGNYYDNETELLDSCYKSKDKDGYRANVIHGAGKLLKDRIYLKGVPDIREMEQKIEEAKIWSEANPKSKMRLGDKKNPWCIYVIWKC